MADYDYYNIEKQLQELDPKILRIDFDYSRERHLIMCWDPCLKEEYIAMSVPWRELDSRVVTHMRRINPEKFNAFEELDRLTAIREAKQEKKIVEMSHSMADMLYKPLLADALS